jgi:A/G-specific adenine glycosylase
MNIDLLSQWFRVNKRDLPWRNNTSAYKVWVSEVMLQQTQAAVVISYFNNWMEKFPTLNALAQACIEDVFKAWEGLGYYSRVKRLHEGAKDIVKFHGGRLPEDENLLSKISGIGPYTLGAILSFAFHQKKPAVDGNVMRVITRYYGITTPVERAQTKKQIYHYVANLLPDENPHEIMESLIELGALVCKKKPLCHKCPIKTNCLAFKENNPANFPVKQKQIVLEKLLRQVYICVHQGMLLVKKPVENQTLMGHLYQLPFSQQEDDALPSYLDDCDFIQTSEEKFFQSFTKYQVTLIAHVYQAKKLVCAKEYVWLDNKEISKCTFSSGDRKILAWMYAKNLL